MLAGAGDTRLHAVDLCGRSAAASASSGRPSEHCLDHAERELADFDQVELREQVTASRGHVLARV
jgi:hypothetical protein